MLNREKHQLVMGRILRDIYADASIAPLLGLKGGTCAYFFYGLPRFSVDLDFDLLKPDKTGQKLIFETIKNILEEHGEIIDSHIKRNTIFFLLSYGRDDHNVKIEVNTRMYVSTIQNNFELKEYLGISMLVGKKPYLFASKLAALTLRSETAMRDIYDTWYFAKNNWGIDNDILKARTNKSVKEHLADCITVIERIKDNQILQGLGELLNEKEKEWVKHHLRRDAIFMLKNYMSVLK
ncbi:MAG: nucleotidyl transferase AbiEii/AbiGii toxin family protein [Patescibacteria group bacterium]